MLDILTQWFNRFNGLSLTPARASGKRYREAGGKSPWQPRLFSTEETDARYRVLTD